MAFDGRLLFASEAEARAAIAAVFDAGVPCAVEPSHFEVRGGDVSFAREGVLPSALYETTIVALCEAAHRAFAGQVRARYNVGHLPPDYQIDFRHAGQPMPGAGGEGAGQRCANVALTGDDEEVVRAHRTLRVKDVLPLSRIYGALPALVYKARLARVVVGRKEPAARRVLADIAAQRASSSDPWAQEIARIVSAIADGRVPQAPPPPPPPSTADDGDPRGEPFLVGWIVEHSVNQGDAGLERARRAVKLEHLPWLSRSYDRLPTLAEKSRLARALVGRPRISGAKDARSILADVAGQTIADGDPDAAEIRAAQAEIAEAIAKPRKGGR
jgi:hypothetical protein